MEETGRPFASVPKHAFPETHTTKTTRTQEHKTMPVNIPPGSVSFQTISRLCSKNGLVAPRMVWDQVLRSWATIVVFVPPRPGEWCRFQPAFWIDDCCRPYSSQSMYSGAPSCSSSPALSLPDHRNNACNQQLYSSFCKKSHNHLTNKRTQYLY